MKWYNKENTKRFKEDIAFSPIEDKLVSRYIRWMPKLAIKFSREYAASGILDLNDLIQIANLHMMNAIRALDYNKIDPNNEEAQIWAYVKRSVVAKIRNEIDIYKDPMRTHRMDGAKRTNAPMDNYLTELFGSFFDEQYHLVIDNEADTMYHIEELAKGLDIVMRDNLSDIDRQIIELSFGIDCEKMTAEKISHIMKIPKGAIEKRKQRAIKKLATEENKKIIENFYTI